MNQGYGYSMHPDALALLGLPYYAFSPTKWMSSVEHHLGNHPLPPRSLMPSTPTDGYGPVSPHTAPTTTAAAVHRRGGMVGAGAGAPAWGRSRQPSHNLTYPPGAPPVGTRTQIRANGQWSSWVLECGVSLPSLPNDPGVHPAHSNS
jgi:hypothetical protein